MNDGVNERLAAPALDVHEVDDRVAQHKVEHMHGLSVGFSTTTNKNSQSSIQYSYSICGTLNRFSICMLIYLPVCVGKLRLS